jgi:energy-coupling factor transporter ATP-binding protein EcfA2
MIDAIIVIGKPGSGKSILIWYLSGLLAEDNVSVHHYSDRLSLEQAVLKDTAHSKPQPNGVKIGKHSKLIVDGPPGHRKVHVLDGILLNRVHDNAIRNLQHTRHPSEVYLVEYAIGPRIDFGKGKEVLMQTADDLVELLKKYRVVEKVFIIDAEASLAIREAREAKRSDAMAPETFRSYFPDGGEISQNSKKTLKKRYYRFNNHEEDHGGYFSEARYIYESMIRPGLVFSGKNAYIKNTKLK